MEQIRQTLTNIKAIDKAADCLLTDVVESAVLLNNMRYYDEVNEIYGELLLAPYPA